MMIVAGFVLGVAFSALFLRSRPTVRGLRAEDIPSVF